MPVRSIFGSQTYRIKPEALTNIFKIVDTPIFQIQVANGQLEKPLATTMLKFDLGVNK